MGCGAMGLDSMLDKIPVPRYPVEMIVKRKQHLYIANGKVDSPFKSVTWYLDVISKPALVPWATKEALNRVRTLLTGKIEGKSKVIVPITALWIEELIKESKALPEKLKTSAADYGTLGHAYADAVIKGKPLPDVPDEMANTIVSFRDWYANCKLQSVMGDTKVCHLKYKYGGSFDALAVDADGNYVIIDFKTSNGTWPEMALQVSAYAAALKDTYGIWAGRAMIVRFGKATPDFEVSEVKDIYGSFNAFLAAKSLKEQLSKGQFKDNEQQKELENDTSSK